MILDEKLIEYLAKLSKLELDDNEKKLFAKQMSDIVSLMDSIGEAEIDEVKINDSVGLGDLREDISTTSYDRDIILKNAPHKKDGFFVVPNIME